MHVPGRDNLPDFETFCKNKQEKTKELEKFNPKKILLLLKMNFAKSVFYQEKKHCFKCFTNLSLSLKEVAFENNQGVKFDKISEVCYNDEGTG